MKPTALRCCCAMLCGVALLIFCAPLAADRYWLLLRDGTTRTGDRVSQLDEPRGSGEDYASLDGDRIFEEDNPARVLRDASLWPARPGAHIELINGDVINGRVLSAAIGEAAAPQPDHLVLGDTTNSAQVRVRLDWVRRIVGRPRGAKSTHASPGQMILADGRQVSSRSLKFSETGVKALTADGIVAATFDQIADLHVLAENAWSPPIPGATWLAQGEGPAVVRTVTAGGEALTFPRSMITKELDNKERERRRRLFFRSRPQAQIAATRPPWSLDTIYLERDNIAFQTFLNADEVPVSLLPVVEESFQAGIHHLPWQRNRNLHGRVLQSGQIAAELGIAMHSQSRLAFQLPAGAKTFSTYVGLDRMAGDGGCVHCRIWRDDETETPLWEHRFLRGSDGVQRVGPLEITGAARLILEVDFADVDRPSGADPLDIRDWVNWLVPLVQVENSPDQRKPEELAQLVPELASWSLVEPAPEHIQLRPHWIKSAGQWRLAIDSENHPLVFARSVNVSLRNAWLGVRAKRDDADGEYHTIRVSVDDKPVKSTAGGDLATNNRSKFEDRAYMLHEHDGKSIELRVTAAPRKEEAEETCGIVWDPLDVRSLLKNLPADGKPIAPPVLLTSLKPAKAEVRGRPLELARGMASADEPLGIRGWPFAEGFGTPTQSEVTYKLDPAWRQFVAVIGLADGWYGAGPYEVLLDGETHWASPAALGRDDPGEQIVVPIPAGHKTITLKLSGRDSIGAWANAGFLLE